MKLRLGTGTTLAYEPRTYDMACRVAHFVREVGEVDCFVTDGGRAMSEVGTYIDARLDGYARSVAKRLLC